MAKHKQGLTSCPCTLFRLVKPLAYYAYHTKFSYFKNSTAIVVPNIHLSTHPRTAQLSNLKPKSLHVVNITELQCWYGTVLPATHIGTDEVKTMVSADINKGGILGQKTITRMQHCASMAQCCCHNVGDV
jgi:hypothetical protein